VSRIQKVIFLFLIAVSLTDCSKKAKSDAELEIGLVISIADRELYIFQEGEKVKTYSIAVGQTSHPTPTGNFEIYQIDWNPDWTPPDSEWTEGASYTPPGHESNPMGRIRMVYLPPYTIHGTQELESLGKAASHGSVRMANEDAIELGKYLMEIGGVAKPEEWYREVIGDPYTMVQVELTEPVPLTNLESWEELETE
jgi:lipoprotein-anchoring transpeptidase ErfK/SrfK